ncbi:MAG: hypothetical protein M1339_00125 [Bacteroidetes bacterium]|nr:hypothetical protein [Bacteroidota bacterium]
MISKSVSICILLISVAVGARCQQLEEGVNYIPQASPKDSSQAHSVVNRRESEDHVSLFLERQVPTSSISHELNLSEPARSWLSVPIVSSSAPSGKTLLENPLYLASALSDGMVSYFETTDAKHNFLDFCNTETIGDSKSPIWQSIFMSLEAGTVAYIAYRHFEKYGLK